MLLSGGNALTASDLMLPSVADAHESATTAVAAAGDPHSVLAGLTLDEAELLLIQGALEREEGNVSAAARELGITRMAMRYRMKKYDLK